MLRRHPPRPGGRAVQAVHPLRRHLPCPRSAPPVAQEPLVRRLSPSRGSNLERPLYFLLNAEGTICAGRVWQGDCILLFTSDAAATAFADLEGVEVRPPLVFSHGRSEFLRQAGRSFGQGYIGGLIDPIPGTRETDFVSFDVDRRS